MKLTMFVASSVALLCVAARPAAAEGVEDLFFDDIALRQGVTAGIHLRVFQNTHVPCRSGTILAIHGAMATANTLEPLARVVTASPVDGRPVCRVVTMDLPGHGQSSVPSGAAFGELTLDDYATAVIEILARLPSEGIRPTTLVGHSMGGLTIQVVQDLLAAEGSSLRQAFAVKHAILLSPALPSSVPWQLRDSGAGAELMVFARIDPVLGAVYDPPEALSPALVFATLDGTIAADTPSAAKMAALSYFTPESMAAMGNFLALEGYEPRGVEPGIFSEVYGTRLDIVAHEQDALISPADLELLLPYLTGNTEQRLLYVQRSDASHGFPISHPAELVELFEGQISLP